MSDRLRAGAIVLLLLLFAIGSTSPTAAAPNEHLNLRSDLSSGPSSCPTGKVVVNVVGRVINDVDVGDGGHFWAFDDYVRQIQIVQLGSTSFCATVKYRGRFTTIAGTSPGGTGTISKGFVGAFDGEYTSTPFNAALLTTPSVRTKGNIGAYDYKCTTSGSCPGFVDWTTLYFVSGVPLTLTAWGWTYHAGKNGTWTNAIDGNSGDITEK